MNLLETRDLSVAFGGVHALRSVSIRVAEGSVVALIGANGAGKSTFLRTVMGIERPQSGAILYDGREIGGLRAHERLDRGLVLSPEGRRLFPEMTVYENIRMGAYRSTDKAQFKARLDHIHEIFPRVAERGGQIAGSLSGGEQQMVAIARALMGSPRLLMLDEPTLGLAPKMVHEVAKLVVRINREGITVLLVEQNAKLAMKISDRAYVLETGAVALEGESAALLDSPEVQNAYLGGGHAA